MSESHTTRIDRARPEGHPPRPQRLAVVGLAVVLGTACSSRDRSSPDITTAPGNGEYLTLTGDALVDLLKARRSGIGNYDAAIVDVLRLQCAGTTLPADISLRKEDIAKILPLEKLDDAMFGFCGSFLLKDGTVVVAAAFEGVLKPAR